jgi:ABC-type glycerol-3-phosphate transport system substrate-binding protein
MKRQGIWTRWVLLILLGMSFSYAQEEVTLTAWTHDQLYLDFFTERLPEWEAMHPDTKFTYDFQLIPNAWDRAIEALAAGETLPDLLGLEQGGFPNYMKDGIIEKYFVDLSDLVAADRADYAEGRMSIYSYNGKLYGLESSLTASVYYYQPKIFEDNGVAVPTTWEEMLAAGEVLGPKGIALNVATNSADWFMMLFNQRGGAVFDKDGNFVLSEETNRAMAIEVADFIQKGVKNGTLFVVLGDDHWGGVTIPTAYREGRLAGQVMPDWWASCCLKPGVEEMSGQWKVGLPPVWSGGGAETLVWGGTGWAVSSQSPNADLAKEFIGFMYLGTESQLLKFEQINMFPWMISAYQDPRVTTLEDPFFGGQKLGEIYAQLADGVPVWYQSPFRSNFSTATGDNLPLLFDGTQSPEAFVDEVIKITQEAIDFGF